MYFLDELKDFKLYKRKVVLPIVESNKKKGSFIYLMTPNTESTINVLNHDLLMPKYFESLYIERDAVLYIGDDGKIKNENDISVLAICPRGTGYISENCLRVNMGEDGNFFVNLQEDAKYNNKIRKLLWNGRIKNIKELNKLYSDIRSKVPYITKTFYDIDRYKGFNLFIDLSYYLALFDKNNVTKLENGMKLYEEFINRILTNGAYVNAGAQKKTLIIDYFGWKTNAKANTWEEVLDWKRTINPLSMMHFMMKRGIGSFKTTFGDSLSILILGKDGYFKINSNNIIFDNLNLFKNILRKLDMNEITEEDDPAIIARKDSSKVITMQTIERIEKSTGISINNIAAPKYAVGTADKTSEKVEKVPEKKIDRGIPKKKEKEIVAQIVEKEKEDLVGTISKAAETSDSADEVLDKFNDNSYLANILDKIAKEDGSSNKVSKARESRIKDLSNQFLNKKMSKNKTVKDMIEKSEKSLPIPEKSIKIDSINEEWQHLHFPNFETVYDPDDDIMSILFFLGTLSHPISVVDVRVEDTTTSEDYIETYFVQCENEKGKRFTLTFDVPKVKQGRFMKLRGNDKILNGQLVLLPCVKTDDDTVQLVSNYNKIFIRRYGTTSGKSCPAVDRLIKALTKYEGKDIKVSWGDCSRICAKYEVPYSYVDLSSVIMRIENKKYIIYLNQDEIRSTYDIPDKILIENLKDNKLPIGYNKESKEILWAINDDLVINDIISYICSDQNDFSIENIQAQTSSTKYCYAMASILNVKIPVVVVLGYTYGLSSMIKITQNTTIEEKVPSRKMYEKGWIKFKDGYLIFDNFGPSGMLYNGLKDCPTEEYSIADMDDKGMWLDFLDEFGGRIKADGLENFADLFVDPKTKTICDLYNLPNNYFDLMLYTTVLLCDNRYNKHTDLTGNRFRENELIAGYAYSCISSAYGAYATAFKRKPTSIMTMKRSAIIDAILVDPTCSDLSKETPLLEKESSSAIGFKGLSGMNSDRSYNLDKRTYDETMINKLALSTGFAENVGITRQMTIDMDVEDNMGTLGNKTNPEDMSVTKSFSITEAMNPMSVTRDDPFRSAMNFVQSYKHTMRTAISHPLLVTNGADEALPYLTSDTFAWKAKGKGKIMEKTDDYMVVQYDNPDIPNEFVDLREKVEKNSDGGFFMSITLKSDLKQGDTVKEGEIIAYDRQAYSDVVGAYDNIAATPGVLTKIAIPLTYEGYEDSTMVTDYLSHIMESEIIVKEEKVLEASTNVYFLIKKGTLVQEGDPLLIYQHAYDDKDVNILLKNLTNAETSEDDISELGRITVRSRYTGIVQDVKVLRTIDTDGMSDSLKKIVNDYESNIRKYKKVMKKYNTTDIEAFDADYKLPPTGVLKNCPEGVKIFIYVKYFDQMSIGDKLVNWSALKGVVKSIPTKGMEPYSEYRPNEEISSMFSMDSINRRMVGSILIVGTINKGLIELDRQVKEIMGIPWKTMKEYDLENLKKFEEENL